MSNRSELIVGWAIIGAIAVGGASVGGVALVNANADQAPAAVVETAEPVDVASLPYTNGLAGEQETNAAAVVAAEQARLAAEAEAARIAAEQAAQAEAERVAAEQAASQETYEPEESSDEPASEPEPVDNGIPAGAWPLPWIADPNPENAQGGYYDDSGCSGGSDTINGVPYCTP